MEQNGHTEWYKKYRPRTLDEVIGQPKSVAVVRGFGKAVPHALLFDGPPGTGKTTLARVVANLLQVSGMDYREINCGSVAAPLDAVRAIQDEMHAAPIGRSRARMFVLDEVQSFSRAKYAQEALLKILEDGPGHCYFALCTTDPKKVNAAIRSRCTRVPCEPIPDADLDKLVRRVAAAEGVELDDQVVEKLVAAAAGSGRTALVELQKIAGLPADKDRLAALGGNGAEKAAFDLVKELMPFRGSPNWAGVASVLTGIKDTDPETVRQLVLSAARTALLRPNNPNQAHAYKVIVSLSDPLFDRNTGHAVLAAGCFRALFGK